VLGAACNYKVDTTPFLVIPASATPR